MKIVFNPLAGKFQFVASAIADISTLQTVLNGKAPVPTGTPDGTKYYRDDNTWVTPPGGSGTFSISQITIDLGWPAVTEKELTIADAGVTAGMKIAASIAYEDTSDKTADEIIVSRVSCVAGKAGAGTYKLGIFAASGPIGGQFKVNITKSV